MSNGALSLSSMLNYINYIQCRPYSDGKCRYDTGMMWDMMLMTLRYITAITQICEMVV